MTAVGIDTLGPEGGHLDVVTSDGHQHHAEGFADMLCSLEKLTDGVRPGIGGDVVVGRHQPHEPITDTAAGEVRDKPGLGERADDVDRHGSQVGAATRFGA